VVLVVVVLLLSGWVVSWKLRGDRSPYPASAISADLFLQLVDASRVQESIDALAGPDRLNASLPTQEDDQSWRALVGYLQYEVPRKAPAEGEYALFVIDKRLNKPVDLMWGIGPEGTNVGQGWEGRYDKVAKKYHWLASLASVRVNGGWTSPGTAVSLPANTPGPITFEAVVDRDAPAVVNPREDFTIALVFIGDNGTIHWAQPLTASSWTS
jgi:hypothetical protein